MSIIWRPTPSGLIVFVIALISIATLAGAEERLQWYAQEGKGRPLCEHLVRIANSNPPVEKIIPNIPWQKVLAIKGVREPDWIGFDPLQYEDFFLQAKAQMEAEGKYEVIPFVRWFLPPKERWADKSVREKPISDADALNIYRDFVRRGGKLWVLRWDVSEPADEKKIFVDFVQYENPSSDFSDWDGYSLQAELGLTGVHAWGIGLGEGYRILMYGKNVFSFTGFRRGMDEYQVEPLSGDRFRDRINEKSRYYNERLYCKIDLKVIK